MIRNTVRNLVVVVGLLALTFGLFAGTTAPPAAADVVDSTSCTNEAYVFQRPGGANGLGHIGFGYAFRCAPGTATSYYYGSVENPAGRPTIPAGEDNGFWQAAGTSTDMFTAMRARGYTNYRVTNLNGTQLNGDAAAVEAESYRGAGYAVLGNNCANAVWDTLNAYGVPSLPLLQIYPAPNAWYGALPGTIWTASTPL
jgi:hypothetical protein